MSVGLIYDSEKEEYICKLMVIWYLAVMSYTLGPVGYMSLSTAS